MTAALAALRAQGAPQREPLRYAYLQALARRAAVHTGAARALLDDKLARAMADCEALLVTPDSATTTTAPHAAQPPPAARPLAGLLAALPLGTPDLKVLQQFRTSWAGLRLDQQLHQSQARVPSNAGPLNTQRLLLQTLVVLREASPGYLQHLMAQVDTLRWLAQATAADAAAPVPPRRGRAERTRKPASS